HVVYLWWNKLLNLETSIDATNLIENLLTYVSKYLLNKTNKYSIIAEQIKKYIKKDYLNSISINSIADNLSYTPNYISYVFKQNFGQNISDYIMELKISKAKELLMDINNKIYNISEILGFSNTSYFCSVFKKHTSLTPKEYRAKNILKDI
ncbi:helix-turn-helix transcriptional regulator, partial [Clostridium arbusti]|uniref:helix-turn-helix transcriptional regulator n=1 Tax=Clostridium arbusti TaxID=1137848 RepID=UPI000287AED5